MAIISEKNVGGALIGVGLAGTLMSAFNIATETSLDAMGIPMLGWAATTLIGYFGFKNGSPDHLFKPSKGFDAKKSMTPAQMQQLQKMQQQTPNAVPQPA